MTTTPATLPDQLKTRDQDRLKAYREHLDFYAGTQWLTASRRERQLTFNYAKVAIDKITSYLMSGLDFAVDPAPSQSASGTGTGEVESAKSKARTAEASLYAVYQANQLDALDFETEVDCAVLGDGAYKITWDAPAARVRVTSPDVQGLFAWWQADDPSQVYRIAQKYHLPTEEAEARYGTASGKGSAYPEPVRICKVPTYRENGDRRGTIEVVEDWTVPHYTLWVDGAIIQQGPNPYGFIPYVVFPNLREPKKFWGTSDIPPITETSRELNRALSQLSRILEVSGNPIAVLENVEDSQDIAVQPNAVWNVPEGAKAYLLDLLEGGGVKLHVDYIELLYRTFHDLAETPRAAFGGIDRDLSGVALEIELHPLLQKVRRKRTIRTAAYRRRNEMILALLSRFTGADFGQVTHRLVWAPTLPQDKGKQAQNEQLLVQSGIHSRRRAMDDLGIMDPEAEFGRWMEERQRIMEMNQRLQARFSRGGNRERASENPADENQA